MKKEPVRVYVAVFCGMRGMYMPDSVSHDEVTSYREFCQIIRDEVKQWNTIDSDEMMRSTGKTRFAWAYVRNAMHWQEVCVAACSGTHNGITVSRSTLEDYEASQDGV